MMSKLVVLIVEDEPLLRMDAADFIAEAGFEVIEAAHADEAIAILKARRDIAVVFTDIEMPGSMDGMKLAHAVRLGWPPVLVVVTSGRVQPREGDLPANVRYLRKPYRPAEVIEAFREAA
jgi:CheY-like chemotaxis protein